MLKREIKSKAQLNKLLNLNNYYGLQVINLGNNEDYKSLEDYKSKNNHHYDLKNNIFIEHKDDSIEITTCYFQDMKNCTYTYKF